MARATALTPSRAHAATDIGAGDEDEDWDSLADSEVAIALLTVLGVIGFAAVLALGLSCVVVLRALT